MDTARALQCRKFHGIGPTTGRKMVQLGIETGSTSEGFLQQHFGKAGSYYYWVARGIDERYQAGECRNYLAHFSLHRGQVARMVRGNG